MIKVNKKGLNHARSLIKQGQVDRDSNWSFDSEDENELLKGDNWDEYGRWFLAVDSDADPQTKAHYKFPYGKNGKVYRSGVIAAKQRAAQNGYDAIEEAANGLLVLIDQDDKKEMAGITSPADDVVARGSPPFPSTTSIQYRTFQNQGEIQGDTLELTASSETPVKRWFGDEVLLHEEGAVDFSPFMEVGAVLINHDPNQRVAVPEQVWIDPQNRKLKARIRFPNTPLAQRAKQEVQEGLLRGVSIGYSVQSWMTLDPGQTWNGYKGPIWIAAKWTVHEISLTPIPADPNVGIGRSVNTKKLTEEKQMEKSTMTFLSAETERQRVREIFDLVEMFDFPPDLAKEMVIEGISVDEARKRLLEKLAKPKEAAPIGQIAVIADERDKIRNAMSDGILMRSGLKPGNVSPGAEIYQHKPLLEIAKECLTRAGIQAPLDPMVLVREAIAHSSSDFPNVLLDAVNKRLQRAYSETPVTYNRWTAKVSASDFKTIYGVQISGATDLEEIKEGAEFTHTTFKDSKESYAISTYGKIFSITRTAIIDDDLRAFDRIPAMLGQAARRTVDKVVYSLLLSNPTMSDGIALFHASHGNVGTAGAISETTLNEARQKFLEQTDASGNLIAISPKYMLVPPAIYVTAAKWMNSTAKPGGTNDEINVFNGMFELIEVPWLGTLPGGSNTAWYLAADPNLLSTIEVAFLNGQDTPTVESQTGFEIDGVKFKVRLDFGVGVMDYRGLFKNAGA